LTKLSTPSWDSNSNFGARGHFILIHPDTRTVHSKSAKGTHPRSGLLGPPGPPGPRTTASRRWWWDNKLQTSEVPKGMKAIPRSEMPRKSLKSLNAPQLFLGAQLFGIDPIRSSRVSPVWGGIQHDRGRDDLSNHPIKQQRNHNLGMVSEPMLPYSSGG
jgi:hypothetical protein